eukprot:TRINITY_DN9106_c0_g1_i9.p2 TRINITY_DN9106_c0_g1~~TRINITY_DN9106_c0_g1_i9.p2  ORF type:complete len:285 (+),score=18.20 TRINITY_DN9106_c0_g1_i9:756-1610(+)
MPLSMVGSTILSEAVWQRVWASENRRALNVGASIAALGVIVLVFFTSFCGFLAYWAGLITPETNENLYFFTLLASRSNQDNNVIVNSWAGVLSMVLAVTMNESAVDSYQNGLVASIGGYFLKGKNVQYVRLSVLLFNVPVVALATLNFNVLDLYLLTDLLCSTSSVPVLFGVYEGKYQKYITQYTMLGACFFSIFSVCALGMIERGSFGNGLYYAWVGNNYDWKYFVVSVSSSIVFIIIWVVALNITQPFLSQKEKQQDLRKVARQEEGQETALLVENNPSVKS